MIGKVVGRQARLDIPFLLPDNRRIEIEFVVDTGFDGFLVLSSEAVTALNLPFYQRIEAILADGVAVDHPVYHATILWEGEVRTVTVLAMGQRPLLGTALMNAQELVIQFAEGGLVTLEKI